MTAIPSNRREFIKNLTAATAGVHFLGMVTPRAQAAPLPRRMNLMLVLTDQERPPMWIPPDWEKANLPHTTRLKSQGLTFSRAFCCTAMCTPSRISMFTGLFPPQHHSPWTLTEDYAQTPVEPQLDPALPNLATCLMDAGYDVIYKGKWHLSHGARGVDGAWIEEDVSRYGFQGWDPPDAGGDTRIENFGGGAANHDQRFINDAKAFLQGRIQNPSDRPFCLIVSLVNPHDVLAYPGLPPGGAGTPAYLEGGYDESWLAGTVPPVSLPPTVNENLAANYKPTAHAAVKAVMAAGLGAVATPQVQQAYLNFYANLMKKVDGQIGEMLSVFDSSGAAGASALDETLIIRTSDHGELGMCHGALRQKAFVAYDEALRVPLIWSNPVLYPAARASDALVSHVDLLPTLCALTGVPDWQSKGFAGIDYSSILLDASAPPVQDHVLFTFDDIYAGGNAANYPNGTVPPPNCLRMIRTADFKYVRYFDQTEALPDQQEFYDLRAGGGDFDASHGLPLESRNLSLWAEARRDHDGIPALADASQQAARTLMMKQLATLETTRLAPRAPTAAAAPEDLGIEVKRWTDSVLGPQAKVQITFLSRLNTQYQLQRSPDLIRWDNAGDPVPGNSGTIVMSDSLENGKAFYRIQWSPAV